MPVAQMVTCSPPTAGVLSSHLGHSMWVLWWMKRGLVRIFLGFLQFSPSTNFIPPFLHAHLIHFVSFYFICLCDGASGMVAHILAIHRPSVNGFQCISSLNPALCQTRAEDIYTHTHEGYFFFFFKVQSVTKLEPQWESVKLCIDVLHNVPSMPIDHDTSHLSILSA